MSDDAVSRITEALSGLPEDGVAVILSGLGVRTSAELRRVEPLRTPLPTPQECQHVRSEVEWV